MQTEEGNLITPSASIIRAASNGDADAVRALLAESADVDQRGRGGHTALMVAAIFGHVDIARLLLAAGADVRLKDNLGLTARDWADRRGSWEVAQLLSNASPPEIEPSPKNTEEQIRTQALPQDREVDDVATSLSEQGAVATWSTAATHSEVEEPRHASATESDIAGQPDTLRFMKFHKQIMAAQERRKAEQARREAEEIAGSTPLETNSAPHHLAFSVADEQQTNVAEPARSKAEAAPPTATQSARIAATIEHLRLLEESNQQAEGEVPTKSNWAAPTGVDRSLESDERDITLERPLTRHSPQPAMFESKTSEPLDTRPISRCPECNTTYENPLLVYCAYDATKLISADDALFSYSAAKDRSRQTLWALVAIVTVVGVSLGYLINNYRSRELVSSAPIAAVSSAPIAAVSSAPLATQTELPAITRTESPLISGELSGMEIDVPEPEFPAQARAEGVSGTVIVRVQVNKKGRVVLARSSRGDWRLRAAAIKAAQKATFSPEKLAIRGKVVSGTITYNFAAQTESPAATGSQVPTPTNSPSANESPSATASSAANVGGDYPVVGGPLVGAESNLPQPAYPEKAKSKGIYGTVTVVVRVNRAGKVISWRTLEGDSQLRAAALKAAKKATFSPTKLPGKGEVVGTITYNFKA